MNISNKIRKIQNSESQNKVREVQEIFGELISDCVEEITLLHIISKVVQDNINGVQNFDDFVLPKEVSYEKARAIGLKYGIRITQGGSGTIYLSWSRTLNEADAESICQTLYEAGHNGLLYEEFERLNSYFPEKHMELLFKSRKEAERLGLLHGKYTYPVFEDAVYLLSS